MSLWCFLSGWFGGVPTLATLFKRIGEERSDLFGEGAN
jgi:hypothetical protein